jgi:hypothetical protein
MRFETLFVVAAILWSGAEAITCWHVDGDALCASRRCFEGTLPSPSLFDGWVGC